MSDQKNAAANAPVEGASDKPEEKKPATPVQPAGK